jgi:hypothetical protein
LLCLGRFLKNYKRSQTFCATFAHGNVFVLIVTKMDCATIWAIFHKLIWSPWTASDGW